MLTVAFRNSRKTESQTQWEAACRMLPWSLSHWSSHQTTWPPPQKHRPAPQGPWLHLCFFSVPLVSDAVKIAFKFFFLMPKRSLRKRTEPFKNTANIKCDKSHDHQTQTDINPPSLLSVRKVLYSRDKLHFTIFPWLVFNPNSAR